MSFKKIFHVYPSELVQELIQENYNFHGFSLQSCGVVTGGVV